MGTVTTAATDRDSSIDEAGQLEPTRWMVVVSVVYLGLAMTLPLLSWGYISSPWLIVVGAVGVATVPAVVQTLAAHRVVAWFTAAVMATALLSWVTGIQRDASPRAALLLAVAAVTLLNAMFVARSRHAARIAIALIASAGGLGALIGLTHWVQPTALEPGNLWRSLGWHNQSATFNVLVASVFLGLAFTLRRRWALAATAAAAFVTMSALSSSRGSIAGGVLAAVIVVAAARPPLRRAVMVVAVGVAATGVFAAGLLTVQGPVVSRSETTVEVSSSPGIGRDQSLTQNGAARLNIWSDTLDMIADRPVTGVGLGGFNFQFWQYRSDTTNRAAAAHNQYLESFADGGILFGFAFLAACAAATWSAWKRAANPLGGAGPVPGIAAGAAGAVIAAVFHQGIDTDWAFPPVVITAAFLLGLCVALPSASPNRAAAGDDAEEAAPAPAPAAPNRGTHPALTWTACTLVLAVSVLGVAGRLWEHSAASGADTVEDLAGTFAPWSATTAVHVGGQLLNSRQPTLARSAAERALPWNPGDKRLTMLVGASNVASGNGDPAALAEEFSAGDHNWGPSYTWAAAALVQSGHPDLALEVADAALERFDADSFLFEDQELVDLWLWRTVAVADAAGCDAALSEARHGTTRLKQNGVRTDALLDLADEACRSAEN